MDLKYETQKINNGFSLVIGCDELGRGCLAGPVVAAAVVLPSQVESKKYEVIKLAGIEDSKILSADKREYIDRLIRQHAQGFGIGVVGEKAIDEINIHNASLLAMKRAIENLLASVSFETNKIFVTVDGKFKIPNCDWEQEAVIDGDAKIISIAAASIVAKVFRDSLMRDLDNKFPGYNFSQHKGYATLHHRTAIKKLGLSPLHRLSFCSQYT